MSPHEIYLKVKGVFHDKITVPLQNALKTVGTAAKSAGKLLASTVGTALESTGSMLGKVTNGVGQMASAFATMGPIGATIAGFSVIVGKIEEKMMAAAKAALEFARSMERSAHSTMLATFNEQLEEANAALAKATTEADRAAAHFDKLANAYLKTASAAAAAAKAAGDLAVSQLAADKEAAIGNAGSKNAAALVGADYDIKIARQKLANAMSEAADKAEAASMEEYNANLRVKAASDRIEAARKALSVAEEKAATASEAYASNTSANDETRTSLAKYAADTEKARLAAAKALQDAELGHTVALQEYTVAVSNSAKVEAENKRQILDANTAIAAAERAKRELELAQAEAKEAEQKRQRIEAEKASLERQREIEKQIKDGHDKLDKAIAERAQAEQDLAAALERYKANFNDNALTEAIDAAFANAGGLGSSRLRGDVITAQGSAFNRRATQHAVDQAIESRGVRTVKDAQILARETSRELAKSTRQEAFQRTKEQQQYDRIARMSPKARSKQDQAFMDQFDKIRARAKRDKDAADAAAKKLKDAQDKEARAREELRSTVKSIYGLLKGLGLK